MPVFGEHLIGHHFVLGKLSGIGTYGNGRIHRLFIAMEFDLLIENIVDELALQDKPGIIHFEQPDFIDINRCRRFEIGSDIFVIVLPFASVPYAMPREGPGIYFKEKFV
jgi:hypothetical protein